MKRIILSLAVIALTTGTAFADDDKPISIDQLPAAASQFIASHFSGIKVSYAKMEKEFFDKSYEVIFTAGSKVEFDGKGEWKEVNCQFTQVPEGIIPQQIKGYVADNFRDAKIVEIERGRRDYEVKLNNRLELKFDLKFNLIDIDD